MLATIGGSLPLVREQDTSDYASKKVQTGITLIYGFSN